MTHLESVIAYEAKTLVTLYMNLKKKKIALHGEI